MLLTLHTEINLNRLISLTAVHAQDTEKTNFKTFRQNCFQ